MTDRTAPADPREALARAAGRLIADGFVDVPSERDLPSKAFALANALAAADDEVAARQDEPSPALREEDLAKALVAASDPTVYDPFDERGNIPLINARHHAKRIVAALAANPLQTREAEWSPSTEADDAEDHGDGYLTAPQTREAEGAPVFRDHETCVPHDHFEPDQERWQRDQGAALRWVGIDADLRALGRGSLACSGSREHSGGCPCHCHTVGRMLPARTPEAQRDAPVERIADIYTDRPLAESERIFGGQRDAGNRARIDPDRLARAIAAHAESHKTHSRTHVRASCAVDIAAEYRATQPPAAGTEGGEAGETP